MAKCVDCEEEMSHEDTVSCTAHTHLIIGGVTYPRNTTYFDVNDRCHDCNIVNKPGNFHHLGCDMERCPKCDGQLISCGCRIEGTRTLVPGTDQK